MVMLLKFYPDGHHDGKNSVLFIIVSLPPGPVVGVQLVFIGYMNKDYASFFSMWKLLANGYTLRLTASVVRSKERLW